MKEFERLTEWPLMPRLCAGLDENSKLISLQTTADKGILEALRSSITNTRTENLRKCKYEIATFSLVHNLVFFLLLHTVGGLFPEMFFSYPH